MENTALTSYSPQSLLKTFLRDMSQKNKLLTAVDHFLASETPLSSFVKIDEIPFSSERKFSACIYTDCSLIIGAPDILLPEGDPDREEAARLSKQAYRVIVFGYSHDKITLDTHDITSTFHELGLLALTDPIREDIQFTLHQLTSEGMSYRIISGDSPDTVEAIVKRIDPNFPIQVINGGELEQLHGEKKHAAILTSTVYARVTPQQKQMIIKTLKREGLRTIMVGDGVNDVLAIKTAHLGIAMNDGAPMAKDTADIILLNNSLTVLPALLFEGRRIVTNVQTIANMYLVKNISSIGAMLMLGFVGLHFPFEPHYISLSSFLVIGLPSFFLACESHTFSIPDTIFIRRLLLFSSIVGFISAISFTATYTFFIHTHHTYIYTRMILLTTVIIQGFFTLLLIYQQFYTLKEIIKRRLLLSLFASMFFVTCAAYTLPASIQFFHLIPVTLNDIGIVSGISLLTYVFSLLFLRHYHLIGREYVK